MNKTVLMLIFTLFLSLEVEFHPNKLKAEHSYLLIDQVPVAVWSTGGIPDLLLQDSLVPAFQFKAVDTKVAGVSIMETKKDVVKAGLDAEAGRVTWETAFLILCVAVCVYLINKGKKQDID